MCVIIGIEKGKEFPFENLRKAVLNNPHGFGIISKDNNILEVMKKYDEKGNDPEVIALELDKRKNVDTFLHLRYATSGVKSEINAHPFTVYNSADNHRVEFMHNGTMYDFKPKDDDNPSDTNRFASEFLSPLLYRWKHDEISANIEDPLLKQILEKFFHSTNRGLLISNKLNPMFLGGWSSFVNYKNQDSFKVSNNEYFHSITDTRLTDYFKEKEKAAKAPTNFLPSPKQEGTPNGTQTTQKGSSMSAGVVTPLREINLAQTGRFLVPKDVSDLFGAEIGELDADTLNCIQWFSNLEVISWAKANPETAALLILHFATAHANLVEDNEKLLEKKESSEKKFEAMSKRNSDQADRIAKLTVELANLKNEMNKANDNE